MKFDHLQASIVNNNDQTPNLYMALCMMESLVLDMEDSSGNELSRCPAGDERLTSKLVWLCRIINDIYKDHDEDLQRNRSRLDKALEKLNDTRRELDALAAVTEQLEAVQKEYNELERSLQIKGADARRCEALTAECARAKVQLEKLAAFDPVAAERELKRLTSSVEAQKASVEGWVAQLNQVQSVAAHLQPEADRVCAETKNIRSQNEQLQNTIEGAHQENVKLREENDRLKAALNAADQEYQQILQEKENIMKELVFLREKIFRSRNGDLEQKQQELDQVRKELEALRSNRSEAEAEQEALENERNHLILEIAHQKKANENNLERLQASQKKLEELRQEKVQLNAALSSCIRELDTLQGDVEQLKNSKLPDAKEMWEQELRCRKELQQNLDDYQAQCEMLKVEILTLQEKLPKLEEEVQNERVIYDALTANCAASSKELESLARQNEELRNNKDEEKLVIYRKQLEETQRQFEQIRKECDQLEQDNVQMQSRLEEGQNTRAKLTELKRRHETAIEVTTRQLQELEFAGKESFLREVTELEERVKLLERVREKLAASIVNMHKFLGHAPIDEKMSMEKQMRFELREMQLRTDDLRCVIVECAKSIKMEVR